MPYYPNNQKNLISALFVSAASYLILSITKNPFPLTSDECFSLYHAQFPIPTIWKELSKGNNPPLFETLLHFWIHFTGYSEVAVRTLPSIITSITAGLLWLLSQHINKSILANVLTVLFFLGSNTILLFSQEIRAYSLLLLFTVLVQLLWLTPSVNKTKSHKILWAVCAAALVYTHFFGFWILLIQGLFELSELINKIKQPPSNKRKIVLTIVEQFWPWLLLLLFYAPYLQVVIFRFVDSASSGTWMEPAPWTAPYFTLWKFTNIPVAVFPTILLLLINFKSAKSKSPIDANNNADTNKTEKYLIASFLIPFLGMWLISVPSPWCVPMFNERYTSFVIPSLALAIASTARGLTISFSSISNNKTLFFLWLILLISQFSFRTISVNQNIDVTTAVREVKNRENASVILEPDHAAFQWLYYTNQTKFKQWRSDSIYHHMTQQLIQEKVYILKTQKSLDSFGLKDSPILYYTHLDNRKTDHTQMIEKQLQKEFNIQPYPFSISRNYQTTLKSKTSELWKLDPKP